nr:hypothetical protein [Tanacetum cinerariifolium]
MDNNGGDQVVYSLVQDDRELRHRRHEKRVFVEVVVFSVVYDSVQWIDENRSSDLALIPNALAEFETGYEHPFTMEACRRILKNHEAWTEVETPSFNQRQQQQLLLDEEALRKTLEKEAKVKKKLEERIKMLEEEVRKEQAHDKLFKLEFEVKSNSEYRQINLAMYHF